MVFEIGSEIRNGLVIVIEEIYLESIMLSVLVIFNERELQENHEIKSLMQFVIITVSNTKFNYVNIRTRWKQSINL